MYSITDDISFPQSLFDLSDHLGLSNKEASYLSWNQLKSEVLVCYKIDRIERLEALLDFVYQDKKFKQADDNYFTLASIDFGSMLHSRSGHALTLGLLIQSLAHVLDLKVQLHLLPVDVIFSFAHEGKVLYFSPLTGKEVSLHEVHCLIRAEDGNLAPLQPEYLLPTSHDDLMLRLMSDTKSSAMLQKKFEIAFYLCNLLIDWQGRHPHWIRERAFVAQQMGCISFASAELEILIEEEPDDPLMDLVKYRLHEMRHQHNVFH